MPAVANIRVNTQVPFPASVTGSGAITVAKQSGGAWTVGMLPLGNLQTLSLISARYPTDYLLVYDTTAGQWNNLSLNALFTGVIGIGGVRFQRSVTSSPIVIGTTDQVLNVNISSGSVSCTLPSAASRTGVPLAFKDVGGNFGAHNLTITPSGGDLIDGAGSLVLNTNYKFVNLVPANDGVNTGWSIE